MRALRRKRLVIGVFIVLTLSIAFLITFMVGQSTGQKSVLADAFVDKVSDQVTGQMNDDITGQIAEKVISDKVKSCVTDDKIEKAVSNNVSEKIPETTKNEIIKRIKKNVQDSMQDSIDNAVAVQVLNMDSLSKGQKTEVKDMIATAVDGVVGDTDTKSISDDDVKNIQNTIESNLKGSLETTITKYIKGNDVTLSSQTIEQITKQINITQAVNDAIKNSDTIVKEKEISKIQNEIIKEVEKNVKTPVKGEDYFTDSEVNEIESASAKKAADSVAGDIKSVKDSVNTITNNISSMQSQITNLNSQIKDSQKESGSIINDKISVVQQSVTNINKQIQQINQAADELGGKINIKNSFLRRITAKKGSIDKAEVLDTSDMTIAEFVGVLSGNEKEYTTAINQLSYDVTQIKNLIGENFKSLSDECASLSASIDANGDKVTTLQEALNAESQKRESEITEIKGSIADNMSDVQNKLDAYKKASQAYADDQSETNRTALEDAKQALQDSLNSYKGNLDTLTDTVDGLDNATQKKVEDINKQIADALDALDAGDSSLDEKITQLSGSTVSLTDALQKAIDQEIQDRKDQIDQTKKELGDSINEQIKNVNDKMSEVEAAQKKYTDDASAESKQALAQAKTDLQTALDQLNQTLSGDISSLDTDTQQKISDVKATIKTLDEQLQQDGTDITTLKNGVAGLTTSLSDVTKSIDDETSERENADNAIKATMGDSSDAADVKGDTIFAKIATLWNKVTAVENKVDATDQWADGIVLANSTGTNSGTTVYYENVTTGTHNGGIRWKIDGNLVGLTNIKSTSNITIQYNASTPDIVCSYEQGAGYLYVYVDKDYKAAALSHDITIDSIHVESEQYN